MKQKKERFRRAVKYWRVRYVQASSQERVAVAMFVGVMLMYIWWVMVRVL